MAWWAAMPVIGDLFKGAGEAVTDVAHVFTEDAEAGAQRAHEERLALTRHDLASLQQFAAEFQNRANRTWWDSFVDGLNRLPRPVMTFGILAFFVLAPVWPERFLKIATAYQAMPEGFWALLGVIVAFYFGGRMQLKGHDMQLKGAALAAARELATHSATVEAEPPAPLRAPAPVPAAKPEPPPPSTTGNKVVDEWLARQKTPPQ
jgi:hypothetical protein